MKPNDKVAAKSNTNKKVLTTPSSKKLKKTISKEETSTPASQPVQQNSSERNNSPHSSKEKSAKVYAGFNYKTIKCMWEQHNKHETDVAPEVYAKLAEDATFKLWELANSIKTFARHSEGNVTVDLVNEVLKDANVAPIVGASDQMWDSIVYDEVFFFNQDEVVDLREEYIKEVNLQQCGPLSLTTTWMAEPRMAPDLVNFCSNLCDSIFLGDEEVFQLAIETCIASPHISSLIKLLITKLIEMLSFDYTVQTLDRSLKFLAALTRNSYTRDLDFFVELGYLCQLLVSLLLGPYAALVHQHNVTLKNEIKPDLRAVDDILDESAHFMDEEAVLNEENNSDHLLLNSNTINDILNNIEKELDPELTKMIDQSESEHDFSATQLETEYFDNYSNESSHQFATTNEIMMINDNMIKSEEGMDERKYQPPGDQQPTVQGDCQQQNVCSPHISEVSSDVELSDASDPVDGRTTIMYTKMCATPMLGELCQTLGMACKWGFVEHECLYWILKRLELFFKRSTIFTFEDYEWIYRTFCGVWAIGEFAFREFSVYLERINPQHMSEFFAAYFNAAGIYLRGRKDSPIYDWLYELGGDGLAPFMVYYFDRLNQFNLRLDRQYRSQNTENIYKIVPKLSLKVQSKSQSAGQSGNITLGTMFPEYQRHVKREKSKFSFRFAGCRPVNVKSKKLKPGKPIVASVEQNQVMLESFNRRIVVGQKKIMTSLSNRKRRKEFMNFGNLII